MAVGPEHSGENRNETGAEDETRTEDVGLPEHEDDARRATDTASGEQNP